MREILFENCYFTVAPPLVKDVTADALLDRITDFKNKTKNDEVILLYFAGHGLQINGSTYIAAMDAALPDDFNLFNRRAFDTNWIIKLFSGHAGIKIFIFDCCRTSSHATLVMQYQVDAARVQGRRVNRANEIIVYATTQNDTAGDVDDSSGDPNHGQFMRAFRRAMANPDRPFRAILGTLFEEAPRSRRYSGIPDSRHHLPARPE